MCASAFQQHVAELRSRIEAALHASLNQKDWPASLREAVEYSLLGTGKRLRPVLVLLAAEVCGGDLKDAMPSACAIEMIHTYSLIHDDLPAMDDDDFRRGRPTSHRKFGEALAILAGDCLLTTAFEVIAGAAEPEATQRAVLTALLAGAAGGVGMVGGQVLDLEAERGPLAGTESQTGQPSRKLGFVSAISADQTRTDSQGSSLSSEIDFKEDEGNRVQQLMGIHRRKTGALITVALEMGAVCAIAEDEDRKKLRLYGECIGLAFQIADDLLDVTGDSEKLGKTAGRDVDLGKLTYPALLGIEESRQRAAGLVDQACQAIDAFGDRSQWLKDLARFIVERDH